MLGLLLAHKAQATANNRCAGVCGQLKTKQSTQSKLPPPGPHELRLGERRRLALDTPAQRCSKAECRRLGQGAVSPEGLCPCASTSQLPLPRSLNQQNPARHPTARTPCAVGPAGHPAAPAAAAPLPAPEGSVREDGWKPVPACTCRRRRRHCCSAAANRCTPALAILCSGESLHSRMHHNTGIHSTHLVLCLAGGEPLAPALLCLACRQV